MSSVETRQMLALEAGQMPDVETGQMPIVLTLDRCLHSVPTRQMSVVETGRGGCRFDKGIAAEVLEESFSSL